MRPTRYLSALLCLVTTSCLLAQPAPVTLDQVERDIAWLVNTERAAAGVSQLASDGKLAAVARAHSEDMRDRGYLAHETPDSEPKLPEDRYLEAFGTKPATLAENIGKLDRSGLDSTTAGRIHASFMPDAQSKQELLRTDVTQIGVGLALGADGTIWATELLVQPGAAPAAPPADATVAVALASPAALGPAPAAAPLAAVGVQNTAPAVRVRIFYPTLEAAGSWSAEIPLIQGQFVRLGLTTPSETPPRLTFRSPGSARGYTPPSVPLYQATSVLVGVSGPHKVELSADAPASCRLVVVSGCLSAVSYYGQVPHGAAALTWDEPLGGSLGDSGFADTFAFTVEAAGPAQLLVKSAPANLRGHCSLTDAAGNPVARWRLARGAQEQPLALPELQPGSYSLTLLDPEALPGTGDYEITLTGR